ncbi:33741_t:CDS:2 [Racocetra persica]|uniref:33741_t:CDS:1 n=1 Tax=Racocetra persica TaxID=160502 RepID=A0ACA9L7S2_9GLOM|nr:33741_t:CDS:2 [Racocetra persica]
MLPVAYADGNDEKNENFQQIDIQVKERYIVILLQSNDYGEYGLEIIVLE